MAARLSLAQQLAELSQAAPIDLDPEDVQAGVLPNDASAADATSGREHYVDVAPSTIRKLNESVIDPKYEGVRTSRKALYEDSEDEPELEEDEHEDESIPSDSEPESHSELEDGEEAQSSGDESQEESPERHRPASSHDQLAQTSAPSAHETPKDDDLASALRKTREEDRQKGKAVSRQIALWDSLLDARIQLQKAVTAANRLPTPAHVQTYVSHASAQESLNGMLREATALSEELFTFQESLLESNESISAPPRKRRKTDHDSPSPSDYSEALRELSSSASALEATYHAHLIPTLAKWSAKVQAVAPSVLLGARSAFTRDKAAAGVVSMVDDVLRADGAKLLARTRTRRTRHARLPPLGASAPAPAPADAADVEDAELFDDTDFYQQLLRDVIRARGGDGQGELDWMAAQRERKARRRAQVDTKASKGRKIRYEVHPKLQNFMVPVPVSRGEWHEEQIDGLFSSLFGAS
ncbi:TRAUB-domain-containing protein [Obba rivulosa]|uniref:Protein BFR2 n=1 Tax=Obba rivulosa TaxID=1052685 RepID=A0A8E2AM03_9APHY|nr:TRAUB-domain-containing protein [Obba rivulosa]